MSPTADPDFVGSATELLQFIFHRMVFVPAGFVAWQDVDTAIFSEPAGWHSWPLTRLMRSASRGNIVTAIRGPADR